MINKLGAIFAIFIYTLGFSQENNLKVYPNYPTDKYSYLGGESAFYTDFHKILLEKKLKPCENKKEIFVANILIDEEGNANLHNEEKPSNVTTKTFLNTDIYENKCTIKLIKDVLPNLDSWK